MGKIFTPINWDFAMQIHANGSVQGIPYVWGAKPHKEQTTDQISGSDCSGWWGYLDARAGGGELYGPETMNAEAQMRMMQSCGLELIMDYAEATERSKKNPIMCFAVDTRVNGGHAAHIWALDCIHTVECYGGVGVGSRSWDSPVLKRIFHAAFVIPVR